MSTAVLWLVLLVVAVGLPFLALYADRRAAAGVPNLPEDAWAFRRRHGLTAAETDLIDRCLQTGARAEHPRLRPLIVERGQVQLDRAGRWPKSPGRRRAAAALLLLPAAALVAFLVLDPPHSATPFVLLLNPLLQVALARRRRGRLRLAVARNRADTA